MDKSASLPDAGVIQPEYSSEGGSEKTLWVGLSERYFTHDENRKFECKPNAGGFTE